MSTLNNNYASHQELCLITASSFLLSAIQTVNMPVNISWIYIMKSMSNCGYSVLLIMAVFELFILDKRISTF